MAKGRLILLRSDVLLFLLKTGFNIRPDELCRFGAILSLVLCSRFGQLLRNNVVSAGIVERRQVDGSERTNHVLLAIRLADQLVPALSQFADLLLGGVLSGSEQELLVVWVVLEMLDLLFAVEHLPALDAEHLTVALLFDRVQLVDESLPLGRVSFDHLSLLVLIFESWFGSFVDGLK